MLDPDQVEQANALAPQLTEEPPGQPETANSYDHEAFVADLDVALERIADQVLGSIPKRLLGGLSGTFEQATVLVCTTMLLRTFTIGRLAEKLDQVLNETREMLIGKNKAYGNSALDPVRVFSQASPREQLLVRLDDKLSRVMRGSDAGEDVVRDMLGYIVLTEIARIREERACGIGGGAS